MVIFHSYVSLPEGNWFLCGRFKLMCEVSTTASCLYQRWFPQDLKWVGLLAPLDAPHHLRKHEHLPYREGSALRGTVEGARGAKGAMGGNGGRKALVTFFFFFCFFFFFLLLLFSSSLWFIIIIIFCCSCCSCLLPLGHCRSGVAEGLASAGRGWERCQVDLGIFGLSNCYPSNRMEEIYHINHIYIYLYVQRHIHMYMILWHIECYRERNICLMPVSLLLSLSLYLSMCIYIYIYITCHI